MSATTEKSTRADWVLPKATELCPWCGQPIEPLAYWTGEGWDLAMDCQDNCTWEVIEEWPFDNDEEGSAKDLEALGFEIV